MGSLLVRRIVVERWQFQRRKQAITSATLVFQILDEPNECSQSRIESSGTSDEWSNRLFVLESCLASSGSGSGYGCRIYCGQEVSCFGC
jgi:hypothetical protein